MIRNISIEEFIDSGKASGSALIDVRTAAEFEQGHIPGAFNVPLFTNEERVKVGTTYKQVGRDEAILLGFDLAGPKWSGFIKQALEISPDKKVALHCWRGGMRSGAMAWALDLYGFDVYLIRGGYKKYRNWVHRQFEKQYRLLVLGGMTGSGKTRILHQLKSAGEQVIDLEDIAQHQGSAFGSMNALVQPPHEQFENNMAMQLNQMDANRCIWVEDESLSIGKCSIPKPFWNQMREAPLLFVNIELEHRVKALVNEYGVLDKDFLSDCTQRIHKRLGPEQTKQALAAIVEDRMADFIRLVLVYYDKTYLNSLSQRNPERVFPLEITGTDMAAIATQLLVEKDAIVHKTAIIQQ